MLIDLFLRGLIIGLAIAAPVGPIGVLCINRTLSAGFAAGFSTGLGAATADGLYGAVAAFGLTAVVGAMLALQDPLRVGGGLFLVLLGILTWRRPPATAAKATAPSSLFAGYSTTVLLTLGNPATILSFLAIFAGLGLAEAPGDLPAALTLVAGVFLGSALWWLGLSGTGAVLRHRLPDATLRWINRLSGAVLITFGLLALLAGRGFTDGFV